MMIKLATLFSGIGAIEQALKQLNIDYEISFACDNGERELPYSKEELENIIKKDKINNIKKFIDDLYESTGKENLMEKSYKNNYMIEDKDFYQDVRFLDGNLYKNQIDLLVGGSPCQSFSVNGKRGGFEDTRGTLFYEYARIVKETQPKVFIFENVRGMLNHDKGKTWETIKNTFKQLNYHINIKLDDHENESPILNAVNFGIPQKRERLFIVGFRNDIKLENEFSFPKEIKLTTTVFDYLDEFVDAKYYLGQKGFEFVTTHPSRARVGTSIMGCQKANQQFNWNGDFIFEEYDKIKFRKDILERAYVSKWNGKKGVIRKYTPRECLRLMGFSDDFKIVINDQNMYRQSGNSIVVNVLKEIVKEIIKTGVFKND
ncbi:MAG: DNA cytosine methyltransferase [Clostridium sp.]|nr:DNA cytosine methyltransferase [Clostridium sp.]